MQVTDELRVLVEAEVARAVENFKKLDGSIVGAEQKTKSLGDALDSISKKSIILSGVIGGAGIAAIKFAGENEKLKASLKNMLGSAEEASAVFEDWRRLGTSPGLSVDEVFTLGRAMVNMGHDTAYATQTIQMLGDVAAGTGSSFGAISGSFERVRAQGKLATRDLSGLQQQGIPVLKQLAKELNTSEEGVRRLAAEGKLGFGDLEKALKGMTSPGGQFAGMMDELSGTTLEKFNIAMDDAKQALASFGEMMLPMATELLDGASSILRGINDMDEGTKRFVLGMGGVVAVSGPIIAAIRGIHAAMTAAMANPYMLAIGGVIAAAGIVAGIINKQANAYEDLQKEIRKTDEASRNLLAAYADGNDAKVLDEKTTRELIKLYPELRGQVKAYTTTVREAAEAQEAANIQRIVNGQSAMIDRIKKDEEILTLVLRNLKNARDDYNAAEASGNQLWIEEAKNNLDSLIATRNEGISALRTQQEEINRVLSRIGKEYTIHNLFNPAAAVFGVFGEIIDIPVTVTVDTSGIDEPDEIITPQAKKRWQDWYGEITKIDPEQFGDSGAKAAELYLTEFSRSFEAGKTVFTELGEEFNIAETLRAQQAEIQKALIDLFSINPEDIDSQFTTIDNSIKPLVEEYKRLGTEAKAAEDAIKAAAAQKEFEQTIADITKRIDDFGKSERQLAYEAELARLDLDAQSDAAKELAQAMDRLSVESTLSSLSREVQNLGKDQYDLALATLAAAGATEEEMRSAEKMIEALRETSNVVDDLGDSFEEFLSRKIAGGLMDIFPELEKQAVQAIGNISAHLAMISFDSLLDGLGALGEAFGKGEDAAESLRQAMADTAQQILNQLPNMFLQAGLQLIAQGQWPLGLGFIAAAGSSALVKGYVDGRIEKEQSAARANAHGNVFDAAIQAFAAGGAFTNQIVSAPTYFQHGGGFGLMGEAGPEAIVPLVRMPSGDLGVQTAGGGTQVTVNIINNTDADIKQEEHENADGSRQIDVIIGEAVNRHIASGKADRVINGRYNLRAAGV